MTETTVLPAGFERVPGRCGGRVTLKDHRIEPGMLYRMHEAGDGVQELAEAYELSVELVTASIEFCRSSAKIVAEWDNAHG